MKVKKKKEGRKANEGCDVEAIQRAKYWSRNKDERGNRNHSCQ